MRKKIFVFMVCLAVIATSSYVTVANFTANSRTRNVITTGNVQLKLVQKTITAENEIVKFEPEKLRETYPGAQYSQMPYVENTGTEDFYTRVFMDVTIIAADGKTLLPNLLGFDMNTNKWVKDTDGWYRYVDIVKSGEETTTPLFTTVSFPLEMGNAYLNATMEITLVAQAVQAEHNTVRNSVLEVTGWPEAAVATSIKESEVG